MKVLHRTYKQIKASLVNRVELFIFFLFFTFSFTGVQSGQSDKKPKPFIADTPPKYNYDSIQRVIDLNYYHIDATNRQTIAQLNKK